MPMFDQPPRTGMPPQAPAQPRPITPPPIRPPMPTQEPEDIFAGTQPTGPRGAAPAPAPMPPKRGGRRIALVFVIFIIIILLVAGGVLAYLSFMQQPVVPLTNLPVLNQPVVNLNTAVNQNVNLNVPVNMNVNQPVAPTPGYTVGVDTDSDSLTNTEETLYGTDPNISDTDKDNYSDGSELINLYDPTRGAGATLANSKLIKIYHDPKYDYSIFYPAKWTVNATATDTTFQSGDEESIKVSAESNPAKVSLYEFVLTQNPTADLTTYTKTKTKGGFDDLISPDKLTHFVTIENQLDKVFVISYTLGADKVANYLSTLQMMVNSFNPVAK